MIHLVRLYFFTVYFLNESPMSYSPTILIGSANAVMYKSENAKFAIKIHSNRCKFLDVYIVIMVRMLPKVPTTAPNTNTINDGIAIPGNSDIN